MTTTTVEGPLVIADISGYTAFIADTELEHSREILTELLECVIAAMGDKLTVAQLEGDAVCFVGASTTPELLGWVEQCFIGFHRRLRDIRISTTCTCRACATVGSLTLKLVAHHGQFSWHRVGNREQLVGTPVNAVHRLLKNHIPSHEYFFASEPILSRLAPAKRAEFTPHDETYDSVGTISGGYRDLAPLRVIAERPERGPVTPEEAQATTSVIIDGSADDAWWVISDPEARRRWMEQTHVDLKPGARGHMLGAEYHCHHGKNKVSIFRVIDAIEPSEITIETDWMATMMYGTNRVVEDAGRVRIDSLMAFVPMPGLKGKISTALIAKGFPSRMKKWGETMQQLINERRASGAADPACEVPEQLQAS